MNFRDFLLAVRGYKPFPWQEELVAKLLAGSAWPTTIALPTAAGKTTFVDIAVFVLASQAGLPAAKRTAPLRIFFVVDRRVVVDEGYQKALQLARELANPEHPVVQEVADRLRSYGGDVPLLASVMRGGMYRDERWTRSPAQPTVVFSTVDQVGSRLLFRGYGVSSGTCNARPIHAGLIGCDALIVLDEVHLSQPFSETLSALQRYRSWAERAPQAPWQVVKMSATAGQAADLSLSVRDREDKHLGQRLSSSKMAKLALVEGEAEDEREALAARMAAEARKLADADASVEVVGIITNRVASARTIFETLRSEADAILLTGRARPWDRDRLMEKWWPRIRAGRERGGQSRLYVVATQCVEVGADIDFDALVTECAALDALRQRFGRLDRLGERKVSQAVIVAGSDQVGRGSDDPIYGPALADTWRWMIRVPGKGGARKGRGKKTEMPGVDFGIDALETVLPATAELTSLLTPRPHAPHLLPAYLDLWVQTSPAPALEPDVTLFLHGPQRGSADVQIVWRADLPHWGLWHEKQEELIETVAVSPPCTAEALAVPVWVLKRWLSGRASDVEDVEGVRVDLDRGNVPAKPVLRWRGPLESQMISVEDVLPGDTVVLPAAAGGIDAFGWNPSSLEDVFDIADVAGGSARRRAILRLYPALGDGIREMLESFHDEEPPDVEGVLDAIVGDERLDTATRSLAERMRTSGPAHIQPYAAGWFLRATLPPVVDEIEEKGPSDFSDEDDTLSLTTVVTLPVHLNGVRELAGKFAARCGLHPEVAEDLRLAAWLHDLGKADARFQIMLHGGDEIAALLSPELLAKSGMDPNDRKAMREAHRRSGYPRGARHEALSLALAESCPQATEGAHDLDLVLHLVGSHHGCGRPFFPVVKDAEVEEVAVEVAQHRFHAPANSRLYEVGSGTADRFWRLVRRYGWHGLAYLEAILRLADQRRSEREAEEASLARRKGELVHV